MKRVAIVNPRFHESIFDGGEILVRKLADHLRQIAEVTILTTTAIDKESWRDEIIEEQRWTTGFKVRRFSCPTSRNQADFNNLHHSLLSEQNHSINNLESWIKQVGPYSESFLNYLKKNTHNYDLFFFVGFNNAFTYFGLPLVKNKSVLIPLAHKEAMLKFEIFDRVFSSPALILPSSQGEKEIIQERFSRLPPMFIIGIDVEAPSQKKLDKTNKLPTPYCLYIGRISRFKGSWELIEQFKKFKAKHNSDLKLVLLGENIDYVKIPTGKDIVHLKKVDEAQKFFLINNSEFLINPSYYESLSLIVLEAWLAKKPVLVNGNSDILSSQVIQSNGGLFYANYQEFAAMMTWLESHPKDRKILGNNGYIWLKNNYSKSIIKKKLEILVNVFANTHE